MNVIVIKTSLSVALGLSMSASGSAQTAIQSTNSNSEVALVSDVEWTPLNPLRGDNGPKAGTLWGDRNGTAPAGFLVTFVDGFSSPPHVHNVTYRGVVISGLVHNDDPDAAKMWMPPGSFWAQPAGEVHVTAAKGSINVAYIEVDTAPYLVLPPTEAFDRGERPINVSASNIVCIDPPGVPGSAEGPRMAFLWGDPQDGQLNGTFVKLPVGFSGALHGNGALLRTVVIKGQTSHQLVGKSVVEKLEPGSYFSSKGDAEHQVSCKGREECIIYVRTKGKFGLIPAQPKN